MKKMNNIARLSLIGGILLGSAQAFAAAPLATPALKDIPYPDDEAPKAEEIALGRMLFFDNRISVNGSQSCATCHNPDLGFSDGLKVSTGAMGKPVARNAPHLYNLAWASAMFWDGRAATLEEQALGPIQAPGEMAMPMDQLLNNLGKITGYQEAFKKAYGSGPSKETVGKAIAAFERTIVSNNSPFDQYLAGNKQALGPEAQRGLALFQGKAGCNQCHDGANLTDDSFHNIGVGDGDIGRGKLDKNPNMVGAFKTPGLRNIALSGPYLHNGSEATLLDVIKFYNRGGNTDKNRDKLVKPLNLSDAEMHDLVAFLGALTDPVRIERPQLPE